ncbi:MAG: hypothetical protein ACK50N_02645, partial [Flavobacteriales bacterium]
MIKTTKLIDKFSGDNFHLWKLKIQKIFERKELWKIVTCEEDITDDMDDNQRDEFFKRDGKALEILYFTLEDTQLSLIQNALTANEAWNLLTALYEAKSPAYQQSLRRKLLSTRMEEGTEIARHIEKIATIAGQLESSGAEIEEADIVSTVLLSLPDTYANIVTVLESGAELPSLAFVREKLYHEELKQKQREKKSEGALVTQHKPQFRRYNDTNNYKT